MLSMDKLKRGTTSFDKWCYDKYVFVLGLVAYFQSNQGISDEEKVEKMEERLEEFEIGTLSLGRS